MDVSDIFKFVLLVEGGVRGARKGGGFGFLLKIPGRGGSPRRGGGGAEGPGGCLRGMWGGRAKYFYSLPNFPPSNVLV